MSPSLRSRLRDLFQRPRGAPPDRPPAGTVRVIVGLGNPGEAYVSNRHNVGFWVVDRLARRHGIAFDRRKDVALGEGVVAGQRVALAKPRTFVNRSGDAVRYLLDRLRLDDPGALLVVCDDLDLPVGTVRLRPKGGHGGHRGLQSIVERLGTEAFPRLRIGIGRPVVDGAPTYDPEHIAAYVLSDPPPEERRLLDDAVERAADAVEAVLRDGLDRAMARYNQ